MCAKNFWFFLVAAIINGTLKVTQNSWDCLLVEDAKENEITKIYSLVIFAGQLSALFAPIASLLVARFTLVPAVRILYANAFIIITVKLVTLYCLSRETGTGKIRMAETKGKSVFSLLGAYGGIIKIIAQSRGTIFSLVIATLVGAVQMVNTTFHQVILSKKLLVPDAILPFFPMARSVLAMFFFFTIIPRITGTLRLKKPLVLGFCAYLAGQIILVFIPETLGGAMYPVLFASLIFDGFGAGILLMLSESLVALYVNKAERARVMAVQHMLIMLATSPFGWVGGLLSGISRNYPFILSALLLALGVAATLGFYAKEGPQVCGTQAGNAEP
jgi:hypothetical protein